SFLVLILWTGHSLLRARRNHNQRSEYDFDSDEHKCRHEGDEVASTIIQQATNSRSNKKTEALAHAQVPHRLPDLLGSNDIE
ncbi:MAG: hypothetical protein Q9174_007115, partial [Haloplaca sp. 1 TL-2023]